MSVLATIIKPKKFFNVSDENDIKKFKSFLKTHAWGSACCPFILEFPYLTIPDMIQDKLIHKILKVTKHD